MQQCVGDRYWSSLFYAVILDWILGARKGTNAPITDRYLVFCTLNRQQDKYIVIDKDKPSYIYICTRHYQNQLLCRVSKTLVKT
jgi:hypothetical protein